jgi:formylglycine-generating enzyme required for sulfatase activity
MKNITKLIGTLALVAVIGFSFTACDNGGGGGGRRSNGGSETDGTENGGGSGNGNGGNGNGGGGTAVTFSFLNANGSSTNSTTQLTLTFSQEITGLNASDITLSGVSGVTKGTLISSSLGPMYTLPITVTKGGTLSVKVAKSGYTISNSPKSVTIYYFSDPPAFPLEVVKISAGTFTMGTPRGESSSGYNEDQHQVTLTKGFYMGKYEVTQGQYETVMGNNPSHHIYPVTGEIQSRRPVEMVTWYDAVEFCNKLSIREGLIPVYTITDRTPATGYPITDATVIPNWNVNGYRLPTEAQWEYACRAGTTTKYYLGDTWDTNWGWIFGNAGAITREAGKKTPNAWGLYDMYGNVQEWCWDLFEDYKGDSIDPVGGSSWDIRVTRGKSIGPGSGDGRLYSSMRDKKLQYERDKFTGFRVIRP